MLNIGSPPCQVKRENLAKFVTEPQQHASQHQHDNDSDRRLIELGPLLALQPTEVARRHDQTRTKLRIIRLSITLDKISKYRPAPFARWSAIFHFHIARFASHNARSSKRLLIITTLHALSRNQYFPAKPVAALLVGADRARRIEERSELPSFSRFGLPLRYHFRSQLHTRPQPFAA
jgi:hypothetical protein